MNYIELNEKLIEIIAKTTKLKTAVYDEWRKQNPDANGGMILSPKALKDAKAAVHDKYGTGSVSY